MGFSLKESGVPAVNAETCTGCGQCVTICPSEVFSLKDHKAVPGKGEFLGCIACGQCIAVCPTNSILVSGRGMMPNDRIELPPPESRASAEELEALMTSRRSVRHFTPREIPRDVLDRIVRMASTAPMGIPPHEVGVVVFPDRQQVKAFVGDACESFGKTAKFLSPLMMAIMRPFIGKFRYEAFHDFIRPLLDGLYAEHKQGRDALTYDATAVMLFHVGPMGDDADCAIVATYAMLAAESLGLGCCMLGTTAALARDQRVKAKYGIPPENKVGVALALGYPAVTYRHAIRRRLASVRFVQ